MGTLFLRRFAFIQKRLSQTLPMNKRHCRVAREHEITNVMGKIELSMYLRNASMTINTSRSNNFSGGPTGSNPKSRKSCGPCPVAKPGRTVLYGKNPRAKKAIPTSCRIEEKTMRRHNLRVFIRGPFLCRPCGYNTLINSCEDFAQSIHVWLLQIVAGST